MYEIEVVELRKEKWIEFLDYLKIHLSENADHDTRFQPLTKAQSQFSSEWEDKFRGGLKKSFGEVGWRQLWLAINQEDKIVGHIDIRSHS